MDAAGQAVLTRVVLTMEGLQLLLDELRARDYRVVGPTVRDQAIVYDDIASLDDLPRGWTDEQDGGHYGSCRAMTTRSSATLSGRTPGRSSCTRRRCALWRSERDASGVRVVAEPHPRERFAFVGVRACELHAIAIQDRSFLAAHTLISTIRRGARTLSSSP